MNQRPEGSSDRAGREAHEPAHEPTPLLIRSMSRRAFLRSSAALGSAALLAACGGPPAAEAPTAAPVAPTTAAEAPTTAAEAPATATEATAAATSAPQTSGGQPRVGGTYRIQSDQADMTTLDPPGASGSEDWWSAGMVLFNMLYSYDATGAFQADLASGDPEISDDALTYTIPIRTGVKFHNGRELTPDDVKFSLERQLWPDVPSWGKSYMENMVGYDEVVAGTTKELSGTKVDGGSVVITLKRPQAVFPALLSMSINGIVPKQEVLDAGADWGIKTVIGTGPFKFVEWQTGQRVVYERHPEYFKQGLPYLDRIEMNLNVEGSIQMLRWESGEAELIRQIPAAERERIESDPELKRRQLSAPVMNVHRLGFQTKVKPFDDVRVRQAIAMAVDKQTLAQAAGGIQPPLEGIYAHPMLQYEADFKSKYQYDLDAAKQLLAEAGYADGIPGVILWAPAGLAEIIQADLQAIGIQAELQAEGTDDYREQIRSGKVALFEYSWVASFPDAYDYISGWTTCQSAEIGFNDGMYCNTKVDDLLQQAEVLPLQDPKRLAAYREIEDIVINQDVAYVGLFNEQGRVMTTDAVHDAVLSPIYSNWPFIETVWMDA